MPCHPKHNSMHCSNSLLQKQYHQILSELERLGVPCHYDTIKLSVLGHYLPSSLSSLYNTVDFIQYCILKSQCSFRWSFNSTLRKVCQTLVLNGHKIRLFIYGCIFVVFSLAHPISGIYHTVVMCVRGRTTFL